MRFPAGVGNNDSLMKDGLETLGALGFSWPSPAYILGVVLFGVLGVAAYLYGKKAARPRTKWLGVALMLYPYLVWQTAWLWVVGVLLCIGIWLDRS